MYAENCQYKLDKMAKTGSRKGQRQPTIEEVKAAKVGLLGIRLQVRPVKNQFSRFFTVTCPNGLYLGFIVYLLNSMRCKSTKLH